MPTGDFHSFISSVKKHGLARTNRYLVTFTPPPLILTDLGINAFSVDVFCNTVTMPGVTFTTVPDKVYGDTIEMPSNKSYGELSMELFVDTGFRTRYMFEKWMNMIEDTDTRNFGYYEDYAASPVVINILDVNGAVTYSMILQEAYPISMNSVQLSQAAAQAPYLLTVQFKYRRYTIVPNALLTNGTTQ